MRTLKKYWWVFLVLVVVVSLWDTILTIASVILVVGLIGGIVFFLLQVPGVRTTLGRFSSWLKRNPLMCALLLSSVLMIVLVIKFAPNLLSTTEEFLAPAETTTTTEAEAAETEKAETAETATAIQATGITSEETAAITEEVLTPESFDEYTIFFTHQGGADTTIVITSDPRESDTEQQVVQYPYGADGKDRLDGIFSFDFATSGKVISSVYLSRYDLERLTFYEYRYEETNDLRYFPYPDQFVWMGPSEVYVSRPTRVTFEVAFTDGTKFQGMFTVKGEYAATTE